MFYLYFFVIKTLDPDPEPYPDLDSLEILDPDPYPDPDSLEMLDPDPYPDPESGSTSLVKSASLPQGRFWIRISVQHPVGTLY
jgi:hypothetical protein